MYGEFASQIEGVDDATMIENARRNWEVSSFYYKNLKDPKRPSVESDAKLMAKIIDQMLTLFEGATRQDQIQSSQGLYVPQD